MIACFKLSCQRTLYKKKDLCISRPCQHFITCKCPPCSCAFVKHFINSQQMAVKSCCQYLFKQPFQFYIPLLLSDVNCCWELVLLIKNRRKSCINITQSLCHLHKVAVWVGNNILQCVAQVSTPMEIFFHSYVSGVTRGLFMKAVDSFGQSR